MALPNKNKKKILFQKSFYVKILNLKKIELNKKELKLNKEN
jgi:hypothetical protein